MVAALNIAAGVVVIRRPEAAAEALAMFAALLFLTAGLFRLVGGLVVRGPQLGWTLVQTGLILTQLGVGYFLMDDPDDTGLRASAYLNAGASGVGLLSLLVLRPPALKARKRVLSLPAGTPKERAAKLRAAEELVEESGKGQKFGTGWAPYTGGAIVGAAVALPLWLKFERPLEATMSFVGAIGFTVVQTLTTPTRARDYRERNPVQLSWGVSLGGVSLSGKF